MKFMGSGVLVIDKPEGITSHGVVQRVKRALGAKKCGHAGTLDPFATGVLVVMVNDATRLAPYLTELDKRYRATIKLGAETDTLDRTGRLQKECPVPKLTIESIKEVSQRFVGEQLQIPPAFSAKRVDGVRLYKLARSGRSREAPPKCVHIYSIEVLEWLPNENLLTVEVHCSKGTYVRVIARDMARSLGTCGHLYRLVRLACGQFNIANSIALSSLGEILEQGKIDKFLIPPSKALDGFEELCVNSRGILRLLNGASLDADDLREAPSKLRDGAIYKVLDEGGELVALVKADAQKALFGQSVIFKPVRVFSKAGVLALGKA